MVVNNPGQLVAPLAIYMDALPYSLVDSVLGVWLVNLVTGGRHVLLLLRKRMVCACGCRGWCTYFLVLSWIHWFIECLAKGRNPERRHDGTPFSDMHDELRLAAMGIALTFPAAVLKLKGDWQEFCERLGFPNWQSGIRPCFCCNAFGDAMYNPIGIMLSCCAWGLNSDEDYDRACSRCELWVVVATIDELRTICAALHWDKRKDGSRGRSLKYNLDSWNLKKDDRLEPHSGLMDVGTFDAITEFPCRALFWRRSQETLCTHRSPIIDSALGVTPNRSIAIDAMHSLLLGPFLSWGKLALWKLLMSGIWGAYEENNESRLRIAIMACRTALVSWYKAEQVAGRFHTRIDFMTAKMVGTPTNPTLKLKAMEAHGFALFLIHCLETYRVPDAHDLLAAGRLMVRLVAVMKAAPPRLSVQTNQDMLNLWKQHMAIMRDQDVFVPKHHLTFHMIMRAVLHGNPWLDATFLDESLNKELKRCCRFAHQATFESTVILKITEVLQRQLQKRCIQ